MAVLCALAASGIPTLPAADDGTGVQALVHAGLTVTDLDRALHFYIGQLGMKEAFRLPKPDGTPKLVYLQVNDSTFIEIFPRPAHTPPSSPVVFHIGLVVRNLQDTLHALQAKGYALPANAFDKAAKLADDGTYYFMVQDPDGNFIELSQMTPDALEAKASKMLTKLAQSPKEH
jgi:catechol 2,3-dioxygenase-like lactoylglutathione lyase family enzyme